MFRPLLWIGIPAAASAAFVLLVIKPTDTPPDEGVAAAWNESIGRLGIWPIYPPEEDIYVGDLWAVLLRSDDEGKTPILQTSARIGHIDLSRLLSSDAARRIRLHTTEPRPETAGAPGSAGGQPSVITPNEVSPSLVAFPGVSFSRGRRAATSFGSGWFGWGASNEGSFSDEIHVTDASTYGVPLGEAYGAMLKWCSVEGMAVCNEAYARRVLVLTGIQGALDPDSGQTPYKYQIELRLVTRVFMAKTIVQRRSTNGARGVAAGTSYDGSAGAGNQPTLPSPAGGKVPATAERAQVQDAAADPAGNGASGLFVRSDGSSVEMRNTYERPIVFGYRAASKLLEPAAPEKGIE